MGKEKEHGAFDERVGWAIMRSEDTLRGTHELCCVRQLVLAGGRRFSENKQTSDASNISHLASDRKAGRCWLQIFTI